MKWFLFILIFFCFATGKPVTAIGADKDVFHWAGTTYINLQTGETYRFGDNEIELLGVKNHYNQIRINSDTVWLKVCYRSAASFINNMMLFIADNKNVKNLSSGSGLHGLLTKDALIAVCPSGMSLIDPYQFIFPVSFTGGYIWRNDEDSYMFSYLGGNVRKIDGENQFPGIALDMKGARGSAKYAILAMESGKVVWINTKNRQDSQPKASLCLASDSFPGIYYIYQNLYSKYIFAKPGQKVERGDELAYIWGDGLLENLHLGIVYRDAIPDEDRWYSNMVNFFPQLMELYYGRQPSGNPMFTKGQIAFGSPTGVNGNKKNVSAFEDYQGTGWKLDKWNTADKVEWVSTRQTGNARLAKVLFEGQPARCINPVDWYDYEINVEPGIYRIRALVGDCLLPTWQKVEYEGVVAGTYELNPGTFTWTPEKIVRVRDGRLTVRIYLGDQTRKAGISQIVFQQAG